MRAVEEGILIFADDVLMAVVMRLDSSVDDEGMRGLWYLETGYGPLDGINHPTFATLDAAQEWISQRLTRWA